MLLSWLWWPLGVATACIVWFFRDPQPILATVMGQFVSPADGRIGTFPEIESEEPGPRHENEILLSILNVHANRVPVRGLITSNGYRAGKMSHSIRPGFGLSGARCSR